MNSMNSTIRNFEQFQASLRAHDWLDGVAPGATDLDVLLEHKGRFLVIEAKRRDGPYVFVPLGQWLALRSLAGLPRFTVLLVAEQPDAKATDAAAYHILTVGGPGPHRPEPEVVVRHGQKMLRFATYRAAWRATNLEGLRAMVRTWWSDA